MYAVIPQSYDTDNDACQTHKVVSCTAESKTSGENLKVWYTDNGKRTYALVDPIYGVFKTRKAAELTAASMTAASPHAQTFRGDCNRDLLEQAEAIDNANPCGPARTAIFAAGKP